MSDVTKAERALIWAELHFAGIVDWAIDLQAFTDDDEIDADGGDGEDYPQMDPVTPCDQGPYTTFDDLDKSGDSWPPHFKWLYTLQILGSQLDIALQNYTNLNNNDYDGKLNTYAKAVVDSAEKEVTDFYLNNGNKYFSCIVTEETLCCDQCSVHYPKERCQYCTKGNCFSSKKRELPSLGNTTDRPPPVHNLITGYTNVSEPCPPDYSARGIGTSPNFPEDSVFWTLNPNTEDAFWADLTNTTGISKDNIVFGNKGSCATPAEKQGTRECLNDGMWSINVPMPHGYDKSDITNPKDIVSKALSGAQNLPQQIKDIQLEMRCDAYTGDASELIDSITLPVSLIIDAVAAMQKVEDIAGEIDAAKRKEIILVFLSTLLFFIPIAGEVAGAANGMATLGRIIAVLGVAGNAAMDIFNIVQDPNNSLLSIFSLVMGPLALGDIATMTKASNIRRGMTDGDVTGLGETVANRMKSIQRVTGACFERADAYF
jgi:chitinase